MDCSAVPFQKVGSKIVHKRDFPDDDDDDEKAKKTK